MKTSIWRLVASLLALGLTACGGAAAQPASSPAAGLHLNAVPAAFETITVDYLQVEGTTYRATIYEPAGSGPFPALLDVHGGAWTHAGLTRDSDSSIDAYLATYGVVVAAIDFRQDDHHRYPDSIEDVNYAMRWLRANAWRFNAWPRLVGALGTSSGGHLVMVNAMRPDEPAYSSRVVTGMPAAAASPDYLIGVAPILEPTARRAFAVQTGRQDLVTATDTYFTPSETLREADPQLLLDRHEHVLLRPALVIQGTADRNIDYRLQERFADTYRAAGGRLDLEEFQGAPHAFVITSPGPDTDRALAMMRSFIASRLNAA